MAATATTASTWIAAPTRSPSAGTALHPALRMTAAPGTTASTERRACCSSAPATARAHRSPRPCSAPRRETRRGSPAPAPDPRTASIPHAVRVLREHYDIDIAGQAPRQLDTPQASVRPRDHLVRQGSRGDPRRRGPAADPLEHPRPGGRRPRRPATRGSCGSSRDRQSRPAPGCRASASAPRRRTTHDHQDQSPASATSSTTYRRPSTSTPPTSASTCAATRHRPSPTSPADRSGCCCRDRSRPAPARLPRTRPRRPQPHPSRRRRPRRRNRPAPRRRFPSAASSPRAQEVSRSWSPTPPATSWSCSNPLNDLKHQHRQSGPEAWDLRNKESRLSESNRRPSHYESMLRLDDKTRL